MITDPDAHSDAAARRRISADLDTNLMVVAGAGTGKTTALIDRIVALVRSGTALGDIAAITFTEAAAAELRQRIGQAVDQAADGGDVALVAARDEVDDATIGTLHAFARGILVEHCVEAGLPSGFEVLDDTAEAADFAVRWSRFADELFEDPEAERALTLGFAVGLRHTDLAAVAWNLHHHWDRLADGGLDYLRAAAPCDDVHPRTDTGPVMTALEAALATATWCTDDDDNMARHLRTTVTEARDQLAGGHDDVLVGLHLLDTLPTLRCSHGRQENWGGHIAEVRTACAEAEQIRFDVLDGVRRAVLGDLVARVAAFTLAAAEERRIEGRITFHDLLVHARRLVRAGGDTVSSLSRRYRRLLIDEFQDTDPIQIELAARLVAAVDGSADVAGARPGGLFVVGDPKQSIYRFRRADIDLFDAVGADMNGTIVLYTNYRSVPAIVDFVNVVFAQIFGEGDVAGQARHHALRAARSGPVGARYGRHHLGSGPAVQLSFDGIEAPAPAPGRSRRRPVGAGRATVAPPPPAVMAVGGPLPVSLAEVRRRAAADAATAIAAVVGGGWTVHDPNDDRRRAARYADVAVLIPARSALPALEDALEESGVPYRLEGAALLWGAEEVRDVLCVLRAVDDPADTVAVLGALRSPGLACGDDDLVTWHGAGGTWDLRAPAPDGLGSHPVAEAMAVLRRLHGRRWWCEPSALVAAAYQELRSFELALSHRRPRDYWHRLRWLQDQARLFDESPGGTMRDFLVWAELRAKGDGRAGGVGPPDPDDDAVRVMTIHGSKGLEFPVTVVAGLERDQADGPPPPAVVWTEHGIPEIHVGRFRSAGFEQAGLRDQRLDVLEQHRLLYVAMTRARDHLILCLHHKERGAHPDSSLAALVTRLCAENPTLWETIPTTNGTNHGNGHRNGNGNGNGHQNGNGQTEGPGQDSPACDLLPSDWESERRLLLDRLRRRPVTSATAVAERAMLENSAARDRAGAPGPPDDAPGQPDDAPLLIGRAVHSALADLDLSTSCDAAGRSADEVARAAAQGVGVGAHASAVAAMVQRALTSATVRRAAIGRHWREVPVAMPVGHGGVLEGFVDLLFQDGDGLVVVDYKTDRIANGHNLGTSVATYRIQLAAYAAALESSTGLPVSRCVLVFLGPDAGAGAVGATGEPWEHVIAGHDLSAAKAEALRVADELSAFGRTR